MSKVNIKMGYEIEVRDAKGKLIERKKGNSDSFVENFIQMLYGLMYGAASNTQGSVTDTSGYPQSYPNLTSTSQALMRVRASAGQHNIGIQVGSGTTPVSKTDYALESKIGHGTGTGQLSYGECSIDAPYEEDGVLKLRIYRNFSNSSGGSITVNEIGIYVSTPAGDVMIARDVLTSPTTVPDGATLTVRYFIQISVG